MKDLNKEVTDERLQRSVAYGNFSAVMYGNLRDSRAYLCVCERTSSFQLKSSKERKVRDGQGSWVAGGVDCGKVPFFFLSPVTASMPADFRNVLENVLTFK